MSRILRSLPLFNTFQQSHFCESLPTLTFNLSQDSKDETFQLFGPISLPIETLKYLKSSFNKSPLKLPKQPHYHAFLASHAFNYEDILTGYQSSDIGYKYNIKNEGKGDIEEEVYNGVLYTAKLHTPYAYLAFTLRSITFNNDISLVLELKDQYVNPCDQHPKDWVLLTAILCHFMDIVLEGITLQTTKESRLSFGTRVSVLIPSKVISTIKLEVGYSLRNLQNAYPHSAQHTDLVSLDKEHDL